jgi:signal transduction histidine kinase
MNLLNNAIDALEKSDCSGADSSNTNLKSGAIQCNTRTIKISTEIVGCSEADPSSSQQHGSTQCAVIRIADNGPGIPKDARKRIFDPFFTTKPVGEGTGLGLSISYQIIVEKHGGQLLCITEPGKGTEFIVEIPLTPSKL